MTQMLSVNTITSYHSCCLMQTENADVPCEQSLTFKNEFSAVACFCSDVALKISKVPLTETLYIDSKCDQGFTRFHCCENYPQKPAEIRPSFSANLSCTESDPCLELKFNFVL